MEFIAIRFLSLVVSLLTVQCYANSGAYSKTHRLLPVLLSCICIYNFYEVVLVFAKDNSVIIVLEQLLFVQFIYISLHYIFDFFRAKIPIFLEVIGFVSLILGDISILLQHISDDPIFYYLYLVLVYVYSAFIAIFTAIFSISRRLKSKRERYVAGMIYLAFTFSIIGVFFRSFYENGEPIMSVCIIITCDIVIYLLLKKYLIDLSQELEKCIFHKSNAPAILFDGRQQYLQSNRSAKESFAESYIQDFKHFVSDDPLLQYNDHFYRCYNQPVISDEKTIGYIVTLTDITDEQQTILSLSEEKLSVEESTRKKNYQLSVLSHKMHSPLNVILGMCDSYFYQDTSSQNVDELMYYIKDSGAELLSYVDEFLLTSGADPSDLEPSLLPEDNVEPTFTFPGARVLVAEDIKTNQEVFRNLVAPWKFQIDFVENGQQAISAVSRNNYQLIFLDKMMPIVNGTDAAHLIKQISDAPLVLISADSTENLPRTDANDDFSGYLTKPFSLPLLKKTIELLMPAEYQVFDLEEDDIFIPDDNHNAVLKLYCDEISTLSEKLRDFAKTDISLYRTTVHGIKSSSKQLDFTELGEEAEILEMAAKLHNMDFINKHTESFISHCHNTIAEIRERI